MGNAEETNELIGKTGSGNPLDGAAKDVAAVDRSLHGSREPLPGSPTSHIALFLRHRRAKILMASLFHSSAVGSF